MIYFTKTPQFIQQLFSDLTWKIHSSSKTLYLTFDDGPHPTITPWVLECLAKYNAKATFFCLGKNVKKFPRVYQEIIANGHQVGNHTQHHLRGWTTTCENYIADVEQCNKLVTSPLFRPPYGRITPKQIKRLKPSYKIIMWDVLSWDFNSNIKKDVCAKNVIKNSKEGSIIVFHDNSNAETNLKYALPKVLEHFSNLGYQFKAIPKEGK